VEDAVADMKPEHSDEQQDAVCAACGKGDPPRYWCEVCGKTVAEKRCPSCGLKARKIR